MKDAEAWQNLCKWHDLESHFDDGERELAKLDAAWAKTALAFRTGVRFGLKGMRTQSMVRVHEMGMVFKRRFDKGDTFSLLQAVAFFAEENLPLPEWLATAYCHALGGFTKPGGVASLDDAFKTSALPTSTPKKAAKAKQDWHLGGEIWHTTWRIVQKDESILSFDAAILAALQQRAYGVKVTTAKRLFLMVERNQIEFIGSKPLSRFLEIRRKQMTSP